MEDRAGDFITIFSVETRRWFVFGRALNHVLVPSVLPILEKYVSDEYHLFLKSESALDGHSKNGFTVRNGMNKKKSDVIKHLKLNEITSPVEYAKCFLENDMKNFNAFDETCDASVVLYLFGNMDCFSVALQNTANAVQKGRNMWAHCNPNEWVDDEFKQRFHDMKQLVVQVGLPASHERKVLADLNYYEGKDFSTSTSELFLTHLHKKNCLYSTSEPSNNVPTYNFICGLTNEVVELYARKLIWINVTESPNVAYKKDTSKLLTSTLEMKAMFAETLHSLDLIEACLKNPSEETVLPLKQLLDRGKCSYTKPPTPNEIDSFLQDSRSFLMTHLLNYGKENKKTEQCENGNLDLDLNSQPNSISPPLSPNYKIRKKKENTNLYGNTDHDDAAQIYDHNPGSTFQKPEDDLVQASLGTMAETKLQDFACLEEDSNGQQCEKGKKPKRKIFNLNVPQIQKECQGKWITGHIGDSRPDKKMKYEKISQENALKGRNSLYFSQPSTRMTSARVTELEDENLSLRKQLATLQSINNEILSELGEVTVEKTAKENEERKSEHFRHIFQSPSQEDKRSVIPNSRKPRSNEFGNNGENGDQGYLVANGSSRPPISNESRNPSVLNSSTVDEAAASSRGHLVNGAEALVPDNNRQPGGVANVRNDENERTFQARNQESNTVNGVEQTATVQNTASIQSTENSSGGEGSSPSGNVEGTRDQASTSQRGLSFSVQQDDSGRESISLRNIPPTSVATTLYNNYKLLLLSFAQNLLSSDVMLLQDWAAQNFSINNPRNATDILFQLDEKGVINASDLHQLSDFFESIVRFDLVHIIDAFLLGDYDLLRQSQASKKHAANLVQNHGRRAITRNPGFLNAMNSGQFSMNTSRNLSRAPVNSGVHNSLPSTQPQSSRSFSDTSNSTRSSVRSLRNQSSASEQQNPGKPAGGFNSVRMAEVTVNADGPVTNERRTTSGNDGTRTTLSSANGVRNTRAVGNGGSKLSKFQRPDNERSNSPNRDPDRDENWLCSHYKRHCYVKFDCCDKFWPCHRCHNNQSTCGRKKLKSRDTKMLKCVYCNKVQQFGEHCCNCGARFAQYYCGMCKHLTGTDDHPYHCEKCGICRIHGDRSFHCDVCGVCLDVQLRGNHKCREGSAHDECCICLEDAFTGCQILPCSHKVHKECATQMIRSGITRCPICRESFAHKLERRPLSSRKRPGK